MSRHYQVRRSGLEEAWSARWWSRSRVQSQKLWRRYFQAKPN